MNKNHKKYLIIKYQDLSIENSESSQNYPTPISFEFIFFPEPRGELSTIVCTDISDGKSGN